VIFSDLQKLEVNPLLSRRYYIATMGCQMNEYDSDYLGQLLLASGYVNTSDPLGADLIIVNTCAVREKAEQKAFSLLGRLVILKRKNPHLIIGMMGCIAQKDGAGLFKRFPDLDFVMGTREIERIHEILETKETTGERIIATDLDTKPLLSYHHEGYFKGRVKGYISIMQGCNNFCSYCIVPYVRGREFSLPPGKIISEAENLVSQGVKEITLLGQNVNSYYSEQESGVDFPGLLRRVNRIDGLKRIRFTTSHPKDLSEKLIRCFGELEKLCPHIHLPFQSGSDRILKRMNRGYTREKYIGLIQRLREVQENVAVTSDVIVGFPGETIKDFQMTLDLIQKIGFDNLFSFIYSDRMGTAAARMADKLDDEEKSSRLALLQKTQQGITLAKNKLLAGHEVEVLVEGLSKRKTQLTGRTDTNKVVNFVSHSNEPGDLVNVMIEDAFVNSLRGTPNKRI